MSDPTFDRKGWLHEVGIRLRHVRRQRGLRQAGLAAEVGIPRATVANIEAGRQGVAADQLWRFAVVLKVPVQKLMPGASS